MYTLRKKNGFFDSNGVKKTPLILDGTNIGFLKKQNNRALRGWLFVLYAIMHTPSYVCARACKDNNAATVEPESD